MRATVFTNRALERHAGQFVWLALDSEKKSNAPLKKKFPVEALPTYLIVDPVDEKVMMRYVGSATVTQLATLFDAAAASYTKTSDTLLVRADRLYGEAKYAEAAAAYGSVLSHAPKGWGGYARAVDSRLYSLQRSNGYETCIHQAEAALPQVVGTPSFASVAASGLDCAISLPDSFEHRDAIIRTFDSHARQAIADTSIVIAADDRSGIYGLLVDARHTLGDSLGERSTLEEWAFFLEGEAARARTPDARAVFDSHRLSVYLELGQPERAVPMLQASERDLPDDYNPPFRLGTAYNAMKKYPEALAAVERALPKAYGPRKIRILRLRTTVYAGMGDNAAATKSRQETLAYAESLPEEQQSKTVIADLKKELAAKP
jgi:tetratricopeptide (TPR) repeat protein